MPLIIDTTPTRADRFTAEQAELLARLTGELRGAAAALERGGPAGRARTSGGEGGRTITIGLAEARALLRAIEPHQLTLGGRGSRTSRLVASLGEWWNRWARLNTSPAWLELPAAIEAGIALRDALGEWLVAMRWHQATSHARVSWPQPGPQPTRATAHITTVLRQSTGAEQNTPGTPATGTPAAKRARRRVAAGQRTLLLPIAGDGAATADTNSVTNSVAIGGHGRQVA